MCVSPAPQITYFFEDLFQAIIAGNPKPKTQAWHGVLAAFRPHLSAHGPHHSTRRLGGRRRAAEYPQPSRSPEACQRDLRTHNVSKRSSLIRNCAWPSAAVVMVFQLGFSGRYLRLPDLCRARRTEAFFGERTRPCHCVGRTSHTFNQTQNLSLKVRGFEDLCAGFRDRGLVCLRPPTTFQISIRL